MPVLQVFEPRKCCSTGVYGPSVDPELARFSSDLERLKTDGVEVRRFNLAQDSGAFVAQASVQEALASRGNDWLPLLLVDERVAVEGSYPSRDALAALTGVVIRKLTVGASCCGPSPTDIGPKKSGCR